MLSGEVALAFGSTTVVPLIQTRKVLLIAGLLTDLKQRGLLQDTLVVWGGEFGRTADTTEAAFNKKKPGRDHNPKAMSMWFAGGGVRAHRHGARVADRTDGAGRRVHRLD